MITDPLPISFTTLSEKKKKKCDMWRVTCDMWHVTHDTWHHLWFMILWRSGGKGWLTQSMNEWISDEAVYRTATATPGLLIKHIIPSEEEKLLNSNKSQLGILDPGSQELNDWICKVPVDLTHFVQESIHELY